MTTAFRHPYLLAALAFLLLIAIAFLVLPAIVVHAPAVHHLGAYYNHGAVLHPDAYYNHG